MLKKILIAAVLIVLTRGLVNLVVKNVYAGPVAQTEVDKIVAETVKKPRAELERMVVANEKSASTSMMSQAELESLVLALNKTYPRTSPSGIRIDRATTGSKLVTYHKTMVNVTIDDLEIPTNSSSFRQAIIKDACSNPGVRMYLRSDISFQVVQRDKNGVLIFNVTTRPKDCV